MLCWFALLDFSLPSRRFDVQSATSAQPFWTSSVLPTASTSNSRLWLSLFGLPRAFPPLQRPIRRSYESLLDFLVPSHRFDVQSDVLTNPFWTLTCLSAALTSNPPRRLSPFGLPPCFPPLQRPILGSGSLFLDFLVPSHRFDVQFSALALSFWTSSCLPTASTSNPPFLRIPFGPWPAFPPLQRPILHVSSSFLRLLIPVIRIDSRHQTISYIFKRLITMI